MIMLIVAALGLLIVIAVVVGIVDATQAPRWRRIAAERRDRWEARVPQYSVVDAFDVEWDDD